LVIIDMLRPQMDPYESQCLSALQDTVVQQRSATLQREAVRLARQRAFLREERRKARQEEAAIVEERAALEHVKRADWWPAEHLKAAGTPAERLRLRVGGQDFEVSKEALCRDDKSLLSALCKAGSPALESAGEDGIPDTVVVDRDWWLFRFIIVFLRDGLIPEDRATALQLYREASFWRLESLQRAIEETHLNLSRLDIKLDDKGVLEETRAKDDDKFWKQKTNWWQAAPPPEPEKPKKKKEDWWKDGPSEDDEKQMAEEWGMTDTLRGTWGYRRGR
jgi:hypothetical protein